MKKAMLLLPLAALLAACGRQNETAAQAPMRVSVVQARSVEFAPTLPLGGTWVARDEIAVAPALQGQKIVSVHTEAGSAVKRGQVLAVLEPETVQSQLRQSAVQLNRARANLNAQQAALREAETLFARYRALADSGAVSRQEFDEQQRKVRTARANIQAARAEIAQMQALTDDSRHQRSKAQIVAPADGIITKRNAEAGALSGADALFVMAKDGQIELKAEANAEDLAQLQTGMEARLETAGQPETAYRPSESRSANVSAAAGTPTLTLPRERREGTGFQAAPKQPENQRPSESQRPSENPVGTVRLIYPAVDSKSRVGKVWIAFEGTPFPIGAYSEARVVLGKRQVAQAVPFSAVSFGSDGSTRVKVVGAGGKVQERKIETGARYQGWVEVRSGLKNGEQVVKQAAAFVAEGDTVAPQPVKE